MLEFETVLLFKIFSLEKSGLLDVGFGNLIFNLDIWIKRLSETSKLPHKYYSNGPIIAGPNSFPIGVIPGVSL